MSLSSFTLDYFDLARQELHINRGLIAIGETPYWLAVVAQLRDLITRDVHGKYSNTVKEKIRQIANHRFSELINNDRASNVYLVAFVLDPGKHQRL